MVLVTWVAANSEGRQESTGPGGTLEFTGTYQGHMWLRDWERGGWAAIGGIGGEQPLEFTPQWHVAGAREEPTHLVPTEFEGEAFGMLISLCKH